MLTGVNSVPGTEKTTWVVKSDIMPVIVVGN